MNFNRFINALDKKFVEDFIDIYFTNSFISYEKSEDENDIYLTFKNEGVEFRFEKINSDIELRTFFIHLNNKKNGFNLYSSKIPFHLSNKFKKDDLKKILGQPNKVNDPIPIIGINYSEVFIKEKFSLAIEYDEKALFIKTISITCPAPNTRIL